jgi:chromosome segregation ATPase
MARGGINRAVVQTARLALLARGEHPSIDAVRVEMGNTGSKTTIHRYLKELDEVDARTAAAPDISQELTELVSRLAQRLEGQAQQIADEARARCDEALEEKSAELAQCQSQLSDTNERLQQQGLWMSTQDAALLATRETLQSEQTENARLNQANLDLSARLQDKDGHIQSLEEKHLNARDALEHYRNAIKEQREQEQRRHEGQLQQLQMELRQAQQQAMVRQEEITALNRDNERLLGEIRGTRRELDKQGSHLEQMNNRVTGLSQELQQSQTRCSLLQERLTNARQEAVETRQQLTEQQQQSRVLELILIKTEVALESLRAAHPAVPDADTSGSEADADDQA